MPVTLSSNGGPVLPGEELKVGPAGLELFLDSPAGEEPTSASLVVEALGGSIKLVSGLSGAIFASDKGPADSGLSQGIKWLSMDWGTSYPITSIQAHINPTEASSGPSVATGASLKVSTGGGWFPPSPVDRVDLGEKQNIPGVVASKALIEAVQEPSKDGDEPTPRIMNIDGIDVEVARQPYDFSVSVGRGTPVYERRGLMPSGEKISVPGLAEAVNRALPEDGSPARVPILMRSATPGEIRIVSFEADTVTVTVRRSLDGQSSPAKISLPWKTEAVGRVTLEKDSTLRQVRFTLTTNLSSQRLHLGPDISSSATSQRCNSGHWAAQGFQPLPENLPLAGVNVYLRPTTHRVAGSLALHPDEFSRPSDAPFTGGVQEIVIEEPGDPPWAPRWVSCQLPRPVSISERPWWLVFSVREGEALWYMDETRPPGALDSMYRLSNGSWLPATVPPEQDSCWLQTHLLVPGSGQSPAPKLFLRRGEAEIKVCLDNAGHANLDSENLSPLNEPQTRKSDSLEVVIRSEVAGEAVLSDLQVRFTPEESNS